jgi:serine protease Do
MSGHFNGISFALPSSTAVEIYNQIVVSGRVRLGFIGIIPRELSQQVARVSGVSSIEGVLVDDVTNDESPAAKAGIKSGDIIVSINGQKIKGVRELIRFIASLPVGSNASIVIMRSGKEQTFQVKVEERQTPPVDPLEIRPLPGEMESTPPGQGKEGGTEIDLGMTLQELTLESAKTRGLTGLKGILVIKTTPGSPASSNGIRTNDLIVEINHKPLSSVEEYKALMAGLRKGDDVVIRVARPEKGSTRPRNLIFSFELP